MNYISIKEYAVKLGVTERQVRNYCADGLLYGATKVGRSWMIPEEAVLVKSRNIESFINNDKPKILKEVKFERIPFIFFSEMFNHYSDMKNDVKILFDIANKYVEGDFWVAQKLAFDLYVSTDDNYIRAECLMLLSYIAIFMNSLDDWKRFTKLLKELKVTSNTGERLKELSLASIDLFVFKINDIPDWIKNGEFSLIPQSSFPFARITFFLYHAISGSDKENLPFFNLLYNEALFDDIPSITVYFAMSMSIKCKTLNKLDDSVRHLKTAVDIAIKYGWYASLAVFRRSIGKILDKELKKRGNVHYLKVKELSETFESGWNSVYGDYISDNPVLTLSDIEGDVAKMFVDGSSCKEIANYLDMSVGSIKNIMSKIYKKLGIKNHKELKELYSHFFVR